jgi:hypothetical protein
LVNAYKNKGVQNKVTFILSAKNLGSIRRVQYLSNIQIIRIKKQLKLPMLPIRSKQLPETKLCKRKRKSYGKSTERLGNH